MSGSSSRRISDRGGGTAPSAHTIKPTKPIAPVSSHVKNSSRDACHVSPAMGKENHIATFKASADTQKTVIRPVPRMDKASTIAINEGEVRVRRSTSSVPRGRSSDPSEFLIGDVRRSRRVSVDRSDKGLVSESDRALFSGGKSLSRVRDSSTGKQRKRVAGPSGIVNGGGLDRVRFFSDFKENGKLKAEKSKKVGISNEIKLIAEESEKATGSYVAGNSIGEVSMSSNSIRSAEVDFNRARENREKTSDPIFNGKLQKETQVNDELNKDSSKAEGEVSRAKKDEKSVKDVIVLEIPEEKSSSAGGIENWAHNKYPSKLHEKLAFLEGKVKRIASDIKRTKEMLETNNSDASKMILSDIQNKICGIEKAMDYVASDSDAKSELPKGSEAENKMVGEGHDKGKDGSKTLGKSLNPDELENRLFPHQRLLRNRESVGSSLQPELYAFDSHRENKVDPMALSPVDENPIALGFLASLSEDSTKVVVRNKPTILEGDEVRETDDLISAGVKNSSQMISGIEEVELILTTDETLDEFDGQENKKETAFEEETEDTIHSQLKEIGFKSSTGGWFVSDGEAVLLAHNDGSCSFYDIANCEEKAEYNPPEGVPPSIWRDCWIIQAPGADGCAGKYVVAASAGNSMDSGFCSWDFYSKEVRAFMREGGDCGVSTSRTILAPLHNNIVYKRKASYDFLASETKQWWYKPCGPLIVSTTSSQKAVKVFDIRDGEEIMRWEVQKPVSTMEFSSPLQWRSRGKVVVAETGAVSLWDVSSLNPHALQTVPSVGRKISALHINNTDAELGGGIRQRVSSSEAEGNDGVFCTQDSINILDFRHPTGVALKISRTGFDAQSVSSRGDSIFLGSSRVRAGAKKQSSSLVQQFSLRKQRLLSSYAFPELNAQRHHTAVSQVWGSSNHVMAVCGLGLFIFDTLKDDSQCNSHTVREVVGPDDLYLPSFDYLASRVLLISRDRPALWRHLS